MNDFSRGDIILYKNNCLYTINRIFEEDNLAMVAPISEICEWEGDRIDTILDESLYCIIYLDSIVKKIATTAFGNLDELDSAVEYFESFLLVETSVLGSMDDYIEDEEYEEFATPVIDSGLEVADSGGEDLYNEQETHTRPVIEYPKKECLIFDDEEEDDLLHNIKDWESFITYAKTSIHAHIAAYMYAKKYFQMGGHKGLAARFKKKEVKTVEGWMARSKKKLKL